MQHRCGVAWESSLSGCHFIKHQAEGKQVGTLIQSLKMKLDSGGRLIESPANRFEIRGTVVINNDARAGALRTLGGRV